MLTRIRDYIQAHNASQGRLPLYLSLGASTAEKNGSLTDALKQADERMYKEKRSK